MEHTPAPEESATPSENPIISAAHAALQSVAGESIEAVEAFESVEGGKPDLQVNPNLTASLRADYDALQNDLHQANELAVDFQRQLAGKSNEVAHLKQLLNKTQRDLSHLQQNILELRDERHRLANECMRMAASEAKLEEVTAERNRLHNEMASLRKGLTDGAEEHVRRNRERDAQVMRLTAEVQSLKQQLVNARDAAAAAQAAAATMPTPQPVSADADVKAELAQLAATVQRLMATVNDRSATPSRTPAPRSAPPNLKVVPPPARPSGDDFIDISFGS